MTRQSYPVKNISIHALRGEGDAKSNRHMSVKETFQSTPSVGRATRAAAPHGGARQHFNPRPPWGGRRHCPPLCLCVYRHFNPRPPWGGRQYDLLSSDLSMRFQSTPSVGRATRISCSAEMRFKSISIHALRGEGDAEQHAEESPRLLFQSTPSVGRATSTPGI